MEKLHISPLELTPLIRAAEVDFRNKLKLSSLFLLMQETAIRHVDQYHIGIDYLAEHNCFWVLSRVKLHMQELPASESKITINTWPTGSDMLFAVRDFAFCNKDNNLIGRATSSWLILDKHSHRPQRHDMLSHLEYPAMDKLFDGHAPKLTPHASMTLSHSQTARYCNIDLNGHVNNAMYVDWMFDTLTETEIPLVPFTFTINFNKETRWGQTVEIYKHNDANGSVFFEVRNNGQSAAVAVLELK
jgi:medium-chain acyl-[acyl-carrier-protein] hydrolase